MDSKNWRVYACILQLIGGLSPSPLVLIGVSALRTPKIFAVLLDESKKDSPALRTRLEGHILNFPIARKKATSQAMRTAVKEAKRLIPKTIFQDIMSSLSGA